MHERPAPWPTLLLLPLLRCCCCMKAYMPCGGPGTRAPTNTGSIPRGTQLSLEGLHVTACTPALREALAPETACAGAMHRHALLAAVGGMSSPPLDLPPSRTWSVWARRVRWFCSVSARSCWLDPSVARLRRSCRSCSSSPAETERQAFCGAASGMPSHARRVHCAWAGGMAKAGCAQHFSSAAARCAAMAIRPIEAPPGSRIG
jgi:hypothetical protein